jgi:hypothetical protein
MSNGNGGNGGSGIIIIRFPDSIANATSVTGAKNSNAPYVTGGYKYYAWNGSGSITF